MIYLDYLDIIDYCDVQRAVRVLRLRGAAPVPRAGLRHGGGHRVQPALAQLDHASHRGGGEAAVLCCADSRCDK